jgi:Uncharacterized protein with conserved CXXC pairs
MGCRITVQCQNQELLIRGQGCKRGELYARDEVTAPKRMVTGVVTVVGSEQLLPVKTAAPIPKEKTFTVMKEIKAVKINPPIHIGQVVKDNIAETGVAVIATGIIEVG